MAKKEQMPMKWCIVLCLVLSGCITPRPDGLYVDRKLSIANATPEQFCMAKDNAELVRDNKVIYSTWGK